LRKLQEIAGRPPSLELSDVSLLALVSLGLNWRAPFDLRPRWSFVSGIGRDRDCKARHAILTERHLLGRDRYYSAPGIACRHGEE